MELGLLSEATCLKSVSFTLRSGQVNGGAAKSKGRRPAGRYGIGKKVARPRPGRRRARGTGTTETFENVENVQMFRERRVAKWTKTDGNLPGRRQRSPIRSSLSFQGESFREWRDVNAADTTEEWNDRESFLDRSDFVLNLPRKAYSSTGIFRKRCPGASLTNIGEEKLTLLLTRLRIAEVPRRRRRDQPFPRRRRKPLGRPRKNGRGLETDAGRLETGPFSSSSRSSSETKIGKTQKQPRVRAKNEPSPRFRRESLDLPNGGSRGSESEETHRPSLSRGLSDESEGSNEIGRSAGNAHERLRRSSSHFLSDSGSAIDSTNRYSLRRVSRVRYDVGMDVADDDTDVDDDDDDDGNDVDDGDVEPPDAGRESNDEGEPKVSESRGKETVRRAEEGGKGATPCSSEPFRGTSGRRGGEEGLEARRVTRGSRKIVKENFIGKLVWGFCSGWWPALIVDAEHVGMSSESGKLWVYWIGEARISLLNEKTQIEPFHSNLRLRMSTQNANGQRIRAVEATMQMLRNRSGRTLTKPYSTWIENNFTELREPLDEIKFYPYPTRVQQRLDHLKERNGKITERYLRHRKRSPARTKKAAERSKESAARPADADSTCLPLGEQHPGVITWAKIAGHNWWPAMIIDYRDCCMREPSFGCQWIIWYGDYKLSEIHHRSFLKFDEGIEKMHDYVNHTKKHVYLAAVLQASKDYCSRLGCETEGWLLPDVFEYFSSTDRSEASRVLPRIDASAKVYDKYSAHIVKKLNELKNNPNIDDERRENIRNSDDLRRAKNGTLEFEKLCLKCLESFDETAIESHPFFQGSLCQKCSGDFKPCMFVFGNDGKCFYCTVCAGSGTVIICDKEDCPRVYCTACMKHLLCPNTYDDVLLEDPWQCFLCNDQSPVLSRMMIKPRPNWKDKIIDMFRTTCNAKVEIAGGYENKRKIRVLSLFDGLSTGLLVLLKLGLNVDVYYASEIDKDALMVSTSHFGDRIVHLGNVKDITKDKVEEMAPIDLLIGGSPCNDLSLANPARLGLYDPNGTGILFFEYCRIMKLVKKANAGRRLFWLYENVASMPTEYRLEINKHLGQEPDVIDSADFSPQHRLRLYWHNLPIEPHSLCLQDEQDVQDILTPHCHRYALVKKIRTVTTKVNSLKQGKLALKPILMKDESDSLWITELEEIFGFPRHYTDVKNLSATKRQKLIGKSWSVQTLAAILRSLCPFFECNANSTD